jgi:WD40 repeat protein
VAGWGSVFISHTSDMADYPPGRSFVQAAAEAVSKAGMHPVDMAQFAAREDTPADYCQRRVRECDVYLAVVGFRYGSRVHDRDDGVSYTELEFLAATEAGTPRLVFVLGEDVAVPYSLVDKDSAAVDAFRERLRNAGVIVKTVGSPAELGEAVLHALYELRSRRPPPDGAATAPGHGAADPGEAGGRRRPWMAPPVDRMVERPELGGRLLAALTRPGPAEVGLTTALQGAGGFGKTTLAAWACHRPEVERRYPGGLLWATIGQEVHGADLAEKVNDLAFVLSGTRPAVADPDTAGAELGRLLDEQAEPVLLVVDDVWDAAQLRPFRFGGRACTRLVTTRIPDLLPAGGPRVLVDAMSAGQARGLVADGVAGLPAGAAQELAAVAGRWPVLLNLVNGVLRRRVAGGQPPDQAAKKIVRRLAADGPAALDPARPSDRGRAVAATVQASLTLLDQADRRRYLDLAVFPEDVDVPLDVLALLWPGGRAEALCEDLVGMGLVADYRLDPPGPRLVVHDVVRAYLRSRLDAHERVGVHRRLVDAATALLPGGAGEESGPPPWWLLPDDAGYLWRFLAYHLHEAGRTDELAALVCDLRWAEAKTCRSGSAVGVEADLALVDTPTAATLGHVLRGAAHLLGPIDPSEALGATLASRVHGVPGLDAVLGRYRAALPRPLLEPAWPLPDQADLAQPSVAVGHTGSVTSCAFSPDGTLLATTSDDDTVRLWQMPAGDQVAVLTGHTGAVWGCAFSPDGALLATASDDRTVRVWRVDTGTTWTVLAHPDWVTNCGFSPDGALLATTSTDGSVRLWRIPDGDQIAALSGHTGGIWGCAFAPDGRTLATTGHDGTVRLWHMPHGAVRAVLSTNTGGVWGCAFSPDGELLATAGLDGTATLWPVASSDEPRTLTGHTSRVWACAFSPDGALLATTSTDGTARLWRTANGTPRAVLAGHTGWLRGCAFSPDGALLATTSNDQTVRLWQVATGSSWAVLASRTRRMEGCAFSPDGTLLATTSDDPTVRLQRLPDGAVQVVLTGPESGMRGCAFSPDGTLLATASTEGTAQLWRVSDGALMAVLTGHDSSGVRDCAFSPDGALLATAGNDRTVRLWQITDGAVKAVLTGHTGRVGRCAFSPDGTLLATASDDRTARLWQVPDLTTQAVLTGHTSWVESCAFSPDGTLLATGGRDGTVRLWQTASGLCRCALRVAGYIAIIAWHPGGTTLCAVGGAGIYLLTYQP